MEWNADGEERKFEGRKKGLRKGFLRRRRNGVKIEGGTIEKEG
jgi:hypothetical protein